MTFTTRLISLCLLVFFVVTQIIVLTRATTEFEKYSETVFNLIDEGRIEASRLLIDFITNKYSLFPEVYALRENCYPLIASSDRVVFTTGSAWSCIRDSHPVVLFHSPPYMSIPGVLLLTMMLCLYGCAMSGRPSQKVIYCILFGMAIVVYSFVLIFHFRYEFTSLDSDTGAMIYSSVSFVSYALVLFALLMLLFMRWKSTSSQ